MCGITGFLQTHADQAHDVLTATLSCMNNTIQHRGPDDSGVWVDETCGIALAMRRLAIVDLSPAGHQPMLSHNGRYVLIFNGEIYNYIEVRKQLLSEVPTLTFRGHSDTEVILEAFERWGIEPTLKRLVGMFAMALWDRQLQTLTLMRDRAGEKPLYYGWLGKVFVFGSELKALRAHPNWQADIDRNALVLYMRHNYVPAPYSIYQGIRKLPAGTFLTISAVHTDESPIAYWSARAAVENGVAHPFAGDEQAAVAELDRLLRQSIAGQMIADVPLGAFLSGGIDSSTVVALMQVQSSQPIKTFTIGFEQTGYNEAEHAKRVARHLGTAHTELYVTPSETLEVIPQLPALYDEPFADSSQIPTFLVSQLARRHVTVSLSGDAGDELFGGYNRYFVGRDVWHKIGWMPGAMRRMSAKGLTLLSPQMWETIFQMVDPILPKHVKQSLPGDKLHKLAEVLSMPDPDTMYWQLVSHWKKPAELVIGGYEPPTTLTNRVQWARVADFTQRMMYLDLVTYLPDDILVKMDRASMGVSLEGRMPFLDHRVIEFAWRVPLKLKIRQGQGKWLLRQVLYQYVPRALLERPKMGFGVPIETWLRGPLRAWAEALLDEGRLRQEGFFQPEPILIKWHEHLSGQRNWQYHLWDVLMFQAWLAEQTTPMVA